MSAETRAARRTSDQELIKAALGESAALLQVVLANPAITMIGGVLIVNQLARRNIVSTTQAYAIEAAILAPAFIHALSGLGGALAAVAARKGVTTP